MCGTGVMQAAGRAGTRALVMQAIALSTMAGWGVVDHLGRGSPTGEATPLSSRVLLFSTPAPALAAWSRLQVWMAVDTEQPVDCCAALYDAAAGPSGGAPASQGHGLVPTAAAITLMVLVAAAWNVYRPRAGSRHAGPLLLAFSAALWVTLAGLVLVHTLAPYHYGVLHHYCPFCFFLPEHRAVGWPLLVSLVVVGIGGQSALVASLTASRVRSLDRVARRGIRMAGIAVLAATILFLVVAVLPVLAWRVRTGVWIDG